MSDNGKKPVLSVVSETTAKPPDTPPTPLAFKDVMTALGQTLLRGGMMLVGNPATLILFLLGLAATVMFGGQFAGSYGTFGAVLAYLAATTLLMGIAGILKKHAPPPEDSGGWFIFLSIIAYAMSAVAGYAAYLGLREHMDTNLALVMAVVGSIALASLAVAAKGVYREGLQTKHFYMLPVMLLIIVVGGLAVEGVPSLLTAGKKAAGIENVRTFLTPVNLAVTRAKEANQVMSSLAAGLTGQIQTLEGRITEEKTPSAGPLSRALETGRDALAGAQLTLQANVTAADAELATLDGRLQKVLKQLNEGGAATDPDALLSELTEIQSKANGIIGAAQAQTAGVTGALASLDKAMTAQLEDERTKNSRNRLAKVNNHIAALSGVRDAVTPVVGRVEAIQQVSEAPRSRGVLAVLLDRKNPEQAYGMAAEVARVMFFAWGGLITFAFWVGVYRPKLTGSPEEQEKQRAEMDQSRRKVGRWLRFVFLSLVMLVVGYWVYIAFGDVIANYVANFEMPKLGASQP